MTKDSLFITGGSRGIGRATVEAALQDGWNVGFTYYNSRAEAEEILSKARKNFPELKCLAYNYDLKNFQKSEMLCDQVLSDFGDLQALICNAGIDIPGNVAMMDPQDWDTVLATNLTGHFHLVRHFIYTFIGNNYGRIVTLSSLAKEGSSGQAAYAASKGAITSFAKSIGKEYGKKGITSNVIVPGMVATKMIQNDTKGIHEFFEKYSPGDTPGKPEDIASAVLFLASRESGYINSAEIRVTGGLDWIF